ncbi:ThiF family adenylyltransferase [Streptacidiphilus griseoplanus]|uniref:ThiF family adenylyltransferase n=1 Tax=Peterkaempfera griseoplana TaxID=66896 RepID=UPI0006E3DE0D|nr:ThiF family adenylyltransferase [Peterkaempfera griseoplana]
MASAFTYEEAFDRNLGLLDADDVARVRAARIGIAGLGGCGSNHLLTLARMGFERFSVADPDTFEQANLNRQAGATVSALGRPKVDVMTRMVHDINPAAEITVFREGISENSVKDFVDGTDVGINAIDFFRADLYPLFHDTYHLQDKHSVVGASPFGFGAAMTVIGPGSPSFSEFFGVAEGDGTEEVLLKFVDRMTPQKFTRQYLEPQVNAIKSPLRDTRISSSAAALQLCAAMTAAEVLFIVTGRRKPSLAPRVLQFDLLLQSLSGAEGGQHQAP